MTIMTNLTLCLGSESPSDLEALANDDTHGDPDNHFFVGRKSCSQNTHCTKLGIRGDQMALNKSAMV